MKLYPTFLDLRGREVLLVGAGAVATHKARGLLAAGAVLRVVAPRASAWIAAAAAAGELAWEARPFAAADVGGAWLVVAATGDGEVNAAVAREAAAQRVFVNAVDDPARCSAYAGSVLTRGPVTVALSSGGRAPALCRILRERLEQLLPAAEELARWTAHAEALRRRWKEAQVPLAQRYQELAAYVAEEAP